MTASPTCKDFYTTHYQPQNAHLLVVGDVTPDGVAAEAREGARRLEERRADRRSRRCRRRRSTRARQIYLVDKPGAAQSAIRIGWVGVARSTPDYFVLDVMNTVLGGSFTSRLNHEPARRARLRLRRLVGLRHARRARAVLRVGERADATRRWSRCASSSRNSTACGSRCRPTS